MHSGSPLDADEILLRRIPPPLEQSTILLPDGTRRPNSDRMTPRKHALTGEVEEALSCSRLRLTSPRMLLEQLRDLQPPMDPSGWGVCWFRVRKVREISAEPAGHLDVTADPTDVDAGHCGIFGPNQTRCPTSKAAARALARIARMLTPEQVATLTAGDTIND